MLKTFSTYVKNIFHNCGNYFLHMWKRNRKGDLPDLSTKRNNLITLNFIHSRCWPISNPIPNEPLKDEAGSLYFEKMLCL